MEKGKVPDVGTEVKIKFVEGHEIKAWWGPVSYDKVAGKVGKYIGITKGGRWCIDFGNIGPMQFTVDIEPGDIEPE